MMSISLTVRGLSVLAHVYFPARVTAATDNVMDVLQEMQINTYVEDQTEAAFEKSTAQLEQLVEWAQQRDMGYKMLETFKINCAYS